MKAKQAIVPVVLANDSKAPTNQLYKPKASPSTLVTGVKFSRTELFLYEEIKAEFLRIILSELSTHESH
ncbi:hypothetical protein SAMN04488700_1602 [Carnobacterium iners]|uniref:Uncharacterized protein n=1 Tax=Carnobacterium iners TaxID=1073423 RepID=A0A1X7NB02_9LACT|nr:hypothetical protein [Carnobacterium iners]SEL07740.1 hypothetical protein SAMN04488114_12410 [Carnobacterium iners]SMH33994.1 hypothetical protein SAMN04488700_1602 [Carnobacterium iners]